VRWCSVTGEVTAGLSESSGSLPPGLWLRSPAGWLPRTRIGSETLRCFEYGSNFNFTYLTFVGMSEPLNKSIDRNCWLYGSSFGRTPFLLSAAGIKPRFAECLKDVAIDSHLCCHRLWRERLWTWTPLVVDPIFQFELAVSLEDCRKWPVEVSGL